MQRMGNCVAIARVAVHEKGPTVSRLSGLCDDCRQRPTLPHSFPCSTIGGIRLNFRVRNGNGCDPDPMTTGILGAWGPGLRGAARKRRIARRPDRPKQSLWRPRRLFKEPTEYSANGSFTRQHTQRFLLHVQSIDLWSSLTAD